MRYRLIGIIALLMTLMTIGVLAGAAGSYATVNVSSSSDISGTENFNVTVPSGAFNSNVSLYIQQTNATGWTFVTSAENVTDVDEYILSVVTSNYIEGIYTLNFTAYQDNAETYNAGNYTTLTLVNIDNANPTIIVSSPTSGGSLTSETNTITATTSEYANGVTFKFGNDEIAGTASGTDNMEWTATTSLSTLSEGAKDFTIAVDGTGSDDDLTLTIGTVTVDYSDSGSVSRKSTDTSGTSPILTILIIGAVVYVLFGMKGKR